MTLNSLRVHSEVRAEEKLYQNCLIQQRKIYFTVSVRSFSRTILSTPVKDRSELLSLEEPQHRNKLEDQPKEYDVATIIQDNQKNKL